MGLGSQSDLSLSEAREKGAEARSILASGRNPLMSGGRPSVRGPTAGHAGDCGRVAGKRLAVLDVLRAARQEA
jgi:hypothetical protein